DPFDTLLTLEDTLYTSAYDLGASDGAHAGRIEGRIFGLEKGFEKFLALGALHGRSQVWGSRIPLPRPDPPSSSSSTTTATATATPEQQEEEGERKEEEATALPLPPLKPNARTARHIQTLHALSDPATFSTLNTEDAVADYDDRVKRAGAKAKMIERLVGEVGDPSSSFSASASASGSGSAAAAAGGASTPRVKLKNEPRPEQNMEDFTGNRLL
ncbi:hypothetical protein BS50DRAFT_460635, partial [Corynespora cassiicola Philippines]